MAHRQRPVSVDVIAAYLLEPKRSAPKGSTEPDGLCR